MDRQMIERRDFSAARRGYDPDEVDEHLRQIADEFARLETSQPRSEGLAGAAAEQVRGIVDAAERSAEQIQQRADEESRRITGEAEDHAREVREGAEAEAAAHVQRVQEAADSMLERADSAQTELNGLVERLRSEADTLIQSLRSDGDALVQGLRGGAESLSGELEQIRAELPELGTRPGGGAAATAVAASGSTSTEPDVDLVDPGEGLADEGIQDEGASEVEPDAPTRAGAAPTLPEEQADTGDELGTEAFDAVGEDASEQAIAGSEGARLIALNMALNGTPREETARYLEENFELDDQEAVLDEVYSRVGG